MTTTATDKWTKLWFSNSTTWQLSCRSDSANTSFCGTLETMNLSFSTIFGLLGSLQGMTLATAIASMGGDAKRPNRALGAIVLVLSATILIVVVEHAGVTEAPLLLILLEHTQLGVEPKFFS